MLRFAAGIAGDMHISDLRVALFNYLVAKQRGEDFIIRIEDIDKKRAIEGKDQELLDLLALFGIEYSQIIHQSQNLKFYAAMALQLLHEKKAFSCFCSDEWLAKKRAEAQEADKDYFYDDACRDLPAELVIDNTAPFRVRIVRPDSAVVIHDKIKGDISFDPDTIDSFVIMHQNKTATDTFAAAVDDMLSDISAIVCSEDHVKKSAQEIYIREQLGYKKEIEYAHIPTLVTDKEDENVRVKYLLEEGYLPEAISNYLISIGNTLPQEIFTLQEAKEWFTFKDIGTKAVSFDLQKLKEINKAHLQKMDAIELSRYVGFADAEIGELARLYLEELNTTRELKLKIAPIFEDRKIPEVLKEQVQNITEVMKQAPYFESYDAFKRYIIDKSNLNEDEFEKSLRIVLTNAQEGPKLVLIYKYLKNYIGEIVK